MKITNSFFATGIRNFTRRKGYTIINILGLAAGITCCLLIFEYVSYERSFDSFQKNADRIYRVQVEEIQADLPAVHYASAVPALAPAMKRDFPEVENTCRLNKADFLLANDAADRKFYESGVYYADAAAMDIFDIRLKEGNAETALSGPGKMLISASEARKYFGQEDPIGKILNVHSGGKMRPLEVTGVFDDYPSNSHLKFDILISYPTRSQVAGTYGKANDEVETSWSWTDFYTYIRLNKKQDAGKLESMLPAFIDKYFNNLPENKNKNDRYRLSLAPLEDIHLHSHNMQEAEVNGDAQSVSFLFAIAFFIACIAWINYINLATARSMERAREVGVRKVMGAVRQQLVRQFMTESFLMNLLALIVAVGLVFLVQPLFTRFTGRPLGWLFHLPLSYVLIFATLFLAGTFLSGFYPALVLSRYNPVTVLKGVFRNASGSQSLRKGLIVGQFGASILLIAGTIIIYRQIHYMRSQQLGINIDQTLVLKGAGGGLPDSSYHDVFEAFKADVLSMPSVKSVTASSSIIGEEIAWSTGWQRLHSGSETATTLYHIGVDNEFIDGYGLKLVAGKKFAGLSSDAKSVIINETAVKALGIHSPEEAIGELLKGGQRGLDSMKVIGVVADYHTEGLKKAIQPIVLLPHRDRRAYYSVKLSAADASATVASIQKTWRQYFPGDPYDYFFLNSFFDRQYAEDRRFGEVFGLFAGLTILIACFGLLGLSAYTVVQRTKEIGIRKVLGASIPNLLFILLKDFLSLIGIAFLIATPLTLIMMNNWLRGFAFRMHIGWWIIPLAGLLAIAAAFLIMSVHTIKAALANPVKSLRTE